MNKETVLTAARSLEIAVPPGGDLHDILVKTGSGDNVVGWTDIPTLNGLLIPKSGDVYNLLAVYQNIPASPNDAHVVIRDGGSQGIHKIFLVLDSLGQPIAWLLNEGGFKVTDVIAFLRGNDLQPMVRLGWLNETDNKAPAIILGYSGTGGTTVTAGGESVAIDAGKDVHIRLTDDAAIQFSKNLRTGLGTSGVTNLGGVGPSLEPGISFTTYLGSGTAKIYRSGSSELSVDGKFKSPTAPASLTEVARLQEIPPMPPILPGDPNNAALANTLSNINGSQQVIGQSLWTIPSGLKLQCRACLTFNGHTTGDVIGIDVIDGAAGSAVVIAEAQVTTADAYIGRVSTGWVDVPSTSWRATMRARNATSARGNARSGWYEFKFVTV